MKLFTSLFLLAPPIDITYVIFRLLVIIDLKLMSKLIFYIPLLFYCMTCVFPIQRQ
jgi:hypothetical protein